MGIEEIEKLYRKLVVGCKQPRIDPQVREKIFRKIIKEIDMVRKRQIEYRDNPEEYKRLDQKLKELLLKEIQVIIDDYIIAKQNGELKKWEEKYGDIKHYIRDFYYFRINDSEDIGDKILVDLST